MTIPPKYEDVVAKLASVTDELGRLKRVRSAFINRVLGERDAAEGREAALREELNKYEPASSGTASKRARWLLNIQDACKYGLPKHLVQRLNNTTKEIQNSIKYGGTKRLRDENESLQQRLTVAEQRNTSITGKVSSCKDCGSSDLFWFAQNTVKNGIQQNRLNTHDVQCVFFLGCNHCSATLKQVSADTIAEKITAALKPAAEWEGS